MINCLAIFFALTDLFVLTTKWIPPMVFLRFALSFNVWRSLLAVWEFHPLPWNSFFRNSTSFSRVRTSVLLGNSTLPTHLGKAFWRKNLQLGHNLCDLLETYLEKSFFFFRTSLWFFITKKEKHSQIQENIDPIEGEIKEHSAKKYSKDYQKSHHHHGHKHKKHSVIEEPKQADPKPKAAPVEIPEPEIQLQADLETSKKTLEEKKQKAEVEDLHLQDLTYEENLKKDKKKKKGHHATHHAETVEKKKEKDQKLFSEQEEKSPVAEKVIEDSFEPLKETRNQAEKKTTTTKARTRRERTSPKTRRTKIRTARRQRTERRIRIRIRRIKTRKRSGSAHRMCRISLPSKGGGSYFEIYYSRASHKLEQHTQGTHLRCLIFFFKLNGDLSDHQIYSVHFGIYKEFYVRNRNLILNHAPVMHRTRLLQAHDMQYVVNAWKKLYVQWIPTNPSEILQYHPPPPHKIKKTKGSTRIGSEDITTDA
ncbi:hypothetical protein CDAR_394561 [Caerostris darwini]|uniref:Uncharacterized protein n=1 Tax=Caerostris darwini TaxID=1538125 RepID=A0AAV4PBU1_9ARAC|nr:hypothetical protein CDAR_394561 [Caerostris darwini]